MYGGVGDILVGFLVSLVVYVLWSRRKLYLISARLPGPFALPIIGNGLYFLCDQQELLQRLVRLTNKYASSPMRIWLGPRLAIFVKDPDQLQIILQSSKMKQKSYIYSFLEPFMGQGLFTSGGNHHKNHRRILQPLFGPTYVEGYSYLFQKHADKLAKALEAKADNTSFDVLHYLHEAAFEATMDIMLEDKNEHSLDYKDMPAYVRRFYYIFVQRILNFWYHLQVIFERTSYYKEQKHMTNIALTMTKEITDSLVPEIQKRLDCKDDVTKQANNEIRTPSMLETLMEMCNNKPDLLTEQEFTDHMMTFVATSQDTQSSAIAFTLMMLGMHPEIQDAVVEELNEALDGKDRIQFGDLGKLKYMEMCLKESMRLFPLGPFLIRDTVEDFPLGDLVLPQGCTVVLGIYNVHKSPKLWEKPNEYYPDHFLPEAASKRHPYAYLPFSAGPRRCIAQNYSYVNMKIIVSTILQKFRVYCEGDLKNLELITDVSIRPKNGYLIKLLPK